MKKMHCRFNRWDLSEAKIRLLIQHWTPPRTHWIKDFLKLFINPMERLSRNIVLCHCNKWPYSYDSVLKIKSRGYSGGLFQLLHEVASVSERLVSCILVLIDNIYRSFSSPGRQDGRKCFEGSTNRANTVTSNLDIVSVNLSSEHRQTDRQTEMCGHRIQMNFVCIILMSLCIL